MASWRQLADCSSVHQARSQQTHFKMGEVASDDRIRDHIHELASAVSWQDPLRSRWNVSGHKSKVTASCWRWIIEDAA
ncbi:hypothetical protein M514_08299 [Trichuris suis]|uniref:Uncharacterized protein n=1 Tax=Trichuris suis TaxID=68888 RepID=A0A085M0W5_9BILA|nr:hypothetical protein M513_08299 [Trichuris suis]KFD68941.1 hypothetical protein M514_08299 [Trichuris suis]